MTKKELIKLLETVPDNFEIRVCTLDSYGMAYESIVENIEIDNDLQTIYLQLEEDDFSL